MAISIASLGILLGRSPLWGEEAAGPARSPLPPAAALASFHIDPLFRIELVAAEPHVADPVAIAWDARGRLWVAEMADYPTGKEGGRVRLLEDLDGDGRIDRAVLFAEGLTLPNGVLPFRRGVLVTAAPDILYLEDADGDGRADIRRAVLTGFHPGNPQLRANGLLHGLDNRVHGANGRSGGRIRRPEDPPAAAVDIGGRDFRFDPATCRFEATAGPSQFGHAFDDWGRRFLSWNTVHIRQEVLSPADLERHPALRRTAAVAAISDHGDSARIYPLSPPPSTFNDEPTDHFNAGCGLTIERGGLFPATHAGNAFVCEPLAGIVHRDRLAAGAGPLFIAHRGEEGKEFLASIDPWFHPVNLQSGPGGGLYVVDFYRRWIEHPEYVRPERRGEADWSEGRGHGRIWRILPREATPWPVIDLEKLGAAELAAQLEHPNAHRRQTAQRLLVERRGSEAETRAASEALAPLLHSDSPLARVHALWTLEGLAELSREAILQALADADARVREHAVRLCRERPERLEDLEVAALALRLAGNESPRVRFAAALALGDLRAPRMEAAAVAALAALARREAADDWFQSAILSSLRGREAAFLGALQGASPAAPAPAGERLAPTRLDELAREAAALLGAGDESLVATVKLAIAAQRSGETARALSLLAGLSSGLGGAGRTFAVLLESGAEEAAGGFRELLDASAELALDGSAPAALRLLAVEALARSPAERSREALAALLEPAIPPELQASAAAALGEQAVAAAAELLIAAWPGAAPALRDAIAAALSRRPELRPHLLQAIERGRIALRDIGAPRRKAILESFDSAGRKRLEPLLGGRASGELPAEEYRAALAAGGDPLRGREHFEKRCASCHRLAGRGHAVGPDLAGAAQKSRAELLAAILDPNQSRAGGYTAYAVVLESGAVLTGIIGGETANAILLRSAGGLEESIARASIADLRALEVSYMPEGLEEGLSTADLQDLLAFLEESRP
jgi:putative membrane-bound dehydrogenase-like protein